MSFFSNFLGLILLLFIIILVLFVLGLLKETLHFLKNLIGCMEVCLSG